MGWNKKVWFLWLQGKEDMPELIKMCYESWCLQNPDYEIIFLDEVNLSKYVNIDDRITGNRNLTAQAYSDIIRINLIHQHGGIWVDANCYCMTPLSEWLPEYMNTGCFMFANPGPDRLIASWFIAATEHHPVMVKYAAFVNRYWLKNPGLVEKRKLSNWKKKILAKRNLKYHQNTSLWFSPFVRLFLKVYPYYYFHYLFKEVLNKHPEFEKVWRETPEKPALEPLKIKHFGFNNPISKALVQEIEDKKSPLYKLTHKIEIDANSENTAIQYLISYHEKVMLTRTLKT